MLEFRSGVRSSRKKYEIKFKYFNLIRYGESCRVGIYSTIHPLSQASVFHLIYCENFTLNRTTKYNY